MSPRPPLPVTVVAGWVGSGKSHLISRLVTEGDEALAVVHAGPRPPATDAAWCCIPVEEGIDPDGDVAARPRHLVRQPAEVTATSAAPGSALLAVGDVSGEVRVWDTDSGATVAAVHAPDEVTALAWSPEGTILAAGAAGGAVALAHLI